MSEEIEVTKIILKIGKKSIELTPAEMKELRDVIDQTFPKEKIVKEHIYIPTAPPLVPWYRRRYWDEPRWTYTSKTTEGRKSATMMLSTK